jgi:hypothetical protein
MWNSVFSAPVPETGAFSSLPLSRIRPLRQPIF